MVVAVVVVVVAIVVVLAHPRRLNKQRGRVARIVTFATQSGGQRRPLIARLETAQGAVYSRRSVCVFTEMVGVF